MNVKNRKCIRKLSLKSLYANRRRNLIAIFAIAVSLDDYGNLPNPEYYPKVGDLSLIHI